MDSKPSAAQMLEQIRNHKVLFHLRRRPRNQDGSLDLRSKVNKGFTKGDKVSDFYDPAKPAANIGQAQIDGLLEK